MNNPYQVLGITEEATDEEIKDAYYRLTNEFINDGEKLREIDDAYGALISEREKNDDIPETGDSVPIENEAQENTSNQLWLKISGFVTGLLNTKEKQRLAIWAGTAVAAVLIVLIIALNMKSDKVGTALKSENYDRVQVTVKQSMLNLNEDTSSETEGSTDSENPYGEATDGVSDIEYGDYGNVYYDENGSMITDGSSSTSSEEQSNTPTETEVCVMKKDGDVIYEEGLSGKCYYYKRDGKQYAMYYDDFYGIYADNGKWTEVSADNYSIATAFDFKVLDDIKKSELKKTKDGYIPKSDTNDIFFNVLKIQNKDKYTQCQIKFYFEQGKITKILANYIYDGGYEITQTYTFAYKDESLKVPKADVVSGADSTGEGEK